jgi:nitroreductase
MEVLEAIRSRRSVKQFRDTPVTKDLIEQALEAALWAPSAQNLQPVRFWVITDREVLGELEGNLYQHGLKLKSFLPILKLLVPQFRGEKGPRLFRSLRPQLFNGAPVLVLIGADRNSSSTYAKDCTLAAMALMLAAEGLGLGSCYFGWTVLVNRMPRWKKRLNIPAGTEIVDGIGLGYATGERHAPPRKAVPEVTTWLGPDEPPDGPAASPSQQKA